MRDSQLTLDEREAAGKDVDDFTTGYMEAQRMTKYKAIWKRDASIVQLRCDRESDHNIWIGERRIPKRDNYSSILDTFEEAKAAIVDCYERRELYARNNLASVTERLERARVMTENA